MVSDRTRTTRGQHHEDGHRHHRRRTCRTAGGPHHRPDPSQPQCFSTTAPTATPPRPTCTTSSRTTAHRRRSSAPPPVASSRHTTRVTLRTDRILDVEAVGGTFRLTSACGDVIDANAVILATGVRDELPAISGLDGLWGDLVAACPFCHGHELTGRRVGIVGATRAAHLVSLLGPIAGDLVVFAHDGEAPEGLPSGVTVLPGPVAAVRRAGDGVEVRLEDGTVESVASLFVGTTLHQRAPFAAQLGLELNPSGCVRIDELGRTSRPGVFAAGDLAHLPAFPMPMSAVILAAAAGQVAASAAIAMPRDHSRIRPWHSSS